MFKVYGCRPRGTVRATRQQPGRKLVQQFAAVESIGKRVECGLDIEDLGNDFVHVLKVVLTEKLTMRGLFAACGLRSWRIVSNGPWTWELKGTKAALAAALRAMKSIVESVAKVKWRGSHGPSYQQPKPYHRR